ncbi:MAG TPA: dehydrogenase, partial [Burkholderiaceae bacterium]
MPYMLLIAEPPGQRAERGVEEGKKVFAEMLSFAESLKARGVLRGVESLASSRKGARVQVREGRTSLVDGPFAE